MKAAIDRIDTLEATERYGTLIHFVRSVRVINVVATDYTVLMTALEALDVFSQPIPVAYGTMGDGTTKDKNLVLTERQISLVDNTTVDVKLTYEHALNDGQSLEETAFYGAIVGTVSTTIQEIETNIDGDGKPITVSHQWPTTDVDFGGPPQQTHVQGGTFKFFQAQRTLSFTGLRTTAYPDMMALKMVGALNNKPWYGEVARMWMCTKVEYTPFDIASGLAVGAGRYKMMFEFQHNPDTWDTTVYFEDARTGKPPTGLVAEMGYKKISKHKEVDFEDLMGVRVAGG